MQPKLLEPAEAWAYLDWITGIIRVNADVGEYVAMRAKIEAAAFSSMTSREVLLMETLTHEATHLMQICTTGFLTPAAVLVHAMRDATVVTGGAFQMA